MILQEIKVRWKSFLIWLVATVGLLAWGMIEYKAMASTLNIDLFSKKLPRIMQAMYGMYGVDVNSLPGYLGVMLFFLIVGLAVHGAFLGCSLIDNEFRDRTAEFLFSKPQSRKRILLRKFTAGLLMVFTFEAVMAVALALVLHDLNNLSYLGTSVLGMVISHVFFYILGFTLAALLPPRKGQIVALFIIVLGYLALVFSQLLDRPVLKNITPIGLFGNKFLENDLIDTLPTAAGFVVGSLALWLMGLFCFERRDLDI